MTVPASGEDLHKADAFFDEAAGHEALAAEVAGFLLVHAIHFADVLGLAIEVDNFGDFHLHAVGELVGFHAGGEVGVLRIFASVLVVEFRECVEGGTLVIT